MCLITRQKKAYIAKKDIICYKVYKRTKIKFTSLSPFRHEKTFTWRGKTIRAKGKLEIDINTDIGRARINGGQIHTFQKVFDIGGCFIGPFDIWECKIPKGTRYYKGMDDDYCSDKIKLIRRV